MSISSMEREWGKLESEKIESLGVVRKIRSQKANHHENCLEKQIPRNASWVRRTTDKIAHLQLRIDEIKQGQHALRSDIRERKSLLHACRQSPKECVAFVTIAESLLTPDKFLEIQRRANTMANDL